MASALADMEEPGKTRRRRVVMQRKVSATEFEKHKARMESLGLDPSVPAPSPPEGDQALLGASAAPVGAGGATWASGPGAEQATRGNTQKQVSLQRRTLGDQILAGRHERALARFNEQQEKWEEFRQRAAKRTGRAKEELVVTRAEEHRERLEVMELLDRATPEEVKSGGHSWYHSLRGEGTRYVQIGNMFSGLHLPIKLHKEEYIHEIVRKPLLTELIASRELDGTKTRKRTWRDDEYLQARIRRYRKKMQELAPGKLEMHELLEPEVVRIGMALAEAGSVQDTICEDDGAQDGTESLSLIAADMLDARSDVAPAPCRSLRTGPHIEVVPDRLEFQAWVQQLSTQCVRLRNVGTAAIGYEWVLNDALHGFQESILPDDPAQCFSCNRTRGQVLPGEEALTVFIFTSASPGSFTASWCLRTYPELVTPIMEVQMHGVATAGDALLERRQGFRGDMFRQQVLHQVRELIEDVVESVDLRPPPPPDLSLPPMQRRAFEAANAAPGAGLYYSPHAWQRFQDLSLATKRLKQLHGREPPAATVAKPPDSAPNARGRRPAVKDPAKVSPPPPARLEDGSPDAHKLNAELAKLPASSDEKGERSELQLDLAREVRAAQRTPLERSPLWWLAQEVVTELVLAIPDKWAAARTAAELKPLPFLPPPDEDASAAATATYEARAEARKELLAEPEREAEVRAAFVETFGKEQFAPAAARFSAAAREVSVLARMQRAATTSLRERFQPYLERQNMDSVEMGGSVVLYELDLSFLDATAQAARESTEVVRLTLEGEEEERARRRLLGVHGVLESSPLSVLVMAHLGEPAPDAVGSEAPAAADASGAPPWPMGLLSLEPLLEPLREACGETAGAVEFVPHATWLGDADAFAERVRSDSEERKVFLLENCSALPEEVGFRRWLQEGVAPPGGQEPPPVGVARGALPWATREAWAARTLGGGLKPDFSVLDSFAAARESLTSHSGLWLGAPQRLMGPSVESELNGLVDALQLPFRASEGDGEARASEPLGAAESALEATPRGTPAPLLIALGGGGFAGEAGEEKLIQKLELLLGLMQLAHHEKDGLLLVLAGELATVVLQGLFGAGMSADLGPAPATALASALREVLLEALGLGVQVQLPVDLVCEEPAVSEEAAATAASPAEPEEARTVPLSGLFAASPAPVLLGFRDGQERYARLDTASGTIAFCSAGAAQAEAEPALAPSSEAQTAEGAAPESQEAAQPSRLSVCDVGDATLEVLQRALRRCRGALWSGALGRWEDERWQRGTRAFLAAVEGRLAGGDEEEAAEEEGEEDEDDEDGEAGGRQREEPEPEAEFEVAVVIGRDSAKALPSLVENPSLVSFVSQSGEGLLQVLRGAPIPGLLACAELT